MSTPSRCIKLPIHRELRAPRICYRCKAGECNRCTMKACTCVKCGKRAQK